MGMSNFKENATKLVQPLSAKLPASPGLLQECHHAFLNCIVFRAAAAETQDFHQFVRFLQGGGCGRLTQPTILEYDKNMHETNKSYPTRV